MAKFISVTGYELYTHIGGLYSHEYDIDVAPVIALGISDDRVVSALSEDLRVRDLSKLDFGFCHALRCPSGLFKFPRHGVLDWFANSQEGWLEAIRGTPEFTELRHAFHILCLHGLPGAKALLAEFNVKNEFDLYSSQYAAFTRRAKQLEAAIGPA